MFEDFPAEVVVSPAALAVAFREDAALDGLAETVSLIFGESLQIVEAAEEEQVSDLLNDFEGVGDATGPEWRSRWYRFVI